MKKNNLFNRVFAFTLTLIVLCICTIMPVYADGPFDGASDNTILYIEPEYITQETMIAIFDYWDYAYEHNMSMGMRLLAIKPITSGSNTTLQLHFSTPDSNVLWLSCSTAGSGSQKAQFKGIDANLNQSAGFCSGYARLFGSVLINSESTLSTLNLGYGNQYAYRAQDGIYFGGGVPSGECWEIAIANFAALEQYVNEMTNISISPPVINVIKYDPTFTLDLGDLFSSIMNAPRAIFEGAFGFELFGINIAETLISLIVVAVVIFIIKKIGGG